MPWVVMRMLPRTAFELSVASRVEWADGCPDAFVPVFKDRKDAERWSGGEAEVLEIEVVREKDGA